MRAQHVGGVVRASVGFKLAAATATILMLAAVTISFLLAEHERRELLERKEQAGLRVAEQLALALSAPLEFDDDIAAREALLGIADDPELVQLRVTDVDRPDPVALSGSTDAPPTFANGRVHWTADALWIAWPIGDASATQGELVLGLSLAREHALWAEQRDVILGGGLGASLLVVALIVVAGQRMVVRPLARLATMAEAFGRGEHVGAPRAGRDEVGRLARSFVTMMGAIGERERRLAEAHAEVGRLLDAMRQAVFVFGPDFAIVGRSSRAAARMFGREDLAGTDVRELLVAGMPDGCPDAIATLSFLDAVFEVPPDAWDMALELAPRELCLHPGTPSEQELVLEFVPLRDRDELVRVMVVATDETQERRVRRDMQSLRDRHAAELAATRRLLGMGASVFTDFASTTATRLGCVKVLLRDPDRTRLDEVLRQVHAARGDARALGLVELSRTLTLAENVLAEVRDSSDPPPPERWIAALREHLARVATDMESARMRLVAASPLGEEVLDQVTVSARDLEELGRCRDRAEPMLRRCIDRVRGRMLGAILIGLEDAALAWAADEGKRVRLEIEGADVRISAACVTGLRTAVVQLVRNAIAHGIEPPAVREARNKPAIGRIGVVARTLDDGVRIEVHDDGGGIDFVGLAARCEQRLDPEQLPFVPGLSTRARANALAGRGVGLSAVRDELAACGYAVALETTVGGGTIARIEPARRGAVVRSCG